MKGKGQKIIIMGSFVILLFFRGLLGSVSFSSERVVFGVYNFFFSQATNERNDKKSEREKGRSSKKKECDCLSLHFVGKNFSPTTTTFNATAAK